MGTYGLKGQIYESPMGKMLTSTKITVIPWSVLRILELRSQKLLWSFTSQYLGQRFSLSQNILQWCETLLKENNDSSLLTKVKPTWEGQIGLPGCPRPKLYS